MAITTDIDLRGPIGLDAHGLAPSSRVVWNPTTSQLYVHALLRGEAELAEGGALVVDTGHHTGRSPNDKFIVARARVERDGSRGGSVNRPISPEQFDALHAKVVAYLDGQRALRPRRLCGRRSARIGCRVRFVTPEPPGTSVRAEHVLLRPTHDGSSSSSPSRSCSHAPNCEADPGEARHAHGDVRRAPLRAARSLIGGTRYAGEIKKSIFTVMNYLLPQRGVLPMHCSANVGEQRRRRRCSSGSRARARRRSRPIPIAELDRRRRARLERRRRVQLRGRLLRQGDQSVAQRPSRRSSRRRARFGTVLENVVLDPATRRARPRRRHA